MSRSTQFKLAGSAWGQAVLHLACACRDGRWMYHCKGALRFNNQRKGNAI